MRPKIGWRSLRTKIIAWSFVPTAIILVAVALVTFSAYERVTEELVIERDRDLTRLSASQLATELTEYTDLLTALARTAEVYRGDPATQRAALKRASDRLAVFDAGVLIFDIRGTVVAAEPERSDALGQNWSNRTCYRELVRSQILGSSASVFSNIAAEGPQGAEVVCVSVPITGEQGELLGAMAGMFRLGAEAVSAFYGDIVKLRIGGNGNVYMVDGSGRTIYHSDADRIGEYFSAQQVVQQVLVGQVGAIRTRDAEGLDIVASFAPVPGTPWGLVIEESWASLASGSQGYRQFLLLLLALGVAVPILVVSVGVRRITRPIGDLINAAREVARGNFGQTITARTGDEVEALAKQFNRMSAQLEESYAHLEQRVADRTRELAALNAIAATASQSLDLDEILNDVLDKMLQVMEIEAGGIYLLDEETKVLTIAAQRGFSPQLVAEIDGLKVGEGFSGRVAQSGQPLVVRDISTDPRLTRIAAREEGFHSLTSAPLSSKGKVLGTLFAVTRGYREFTEQDVQLLTSIGHQIGVAVENALLYEQAQELAAVEERQRLARDLHDAVTQTLFSASLIAEALPDLWQLDRVQGQQHLVKLRQLSRGALAEMRTLLLELRPAGLAEASLKDLLHQLGQAAAGRKGIPVTVTVDEPCELPTDVHVTLYRIAQEALNNVVKHAQASQVAVTLRCAPPLPPSTSSGQKRTLELCISDDGCGFDPRTVSAEHLGLGIMRERAVAIGARLEIDSKPGHGTKVRVVWTEDEGPVTNDK